MRSNRASLCKLTHAHTHDWTVCVVSSRDWYETGAKLIEIFFCFLMALLPKTTNRTTARTMKTTKRTTTKGTTSKGMFKTLPVLSGPKMKAKLFVHSSEYTNVIFCIL